MSGSEGAPRAATRAKGSWVNLREKTGSGFVVAQRGKILAKCRLPFVGSRSTLICSVVVFASAFTDGRRDDALQLVHADAPPFCPCRHLPGLQLEPAMQGKFSEYGVLHNDI